MDSSSAAPTPSTSALSKINATTAHKKKGATKATRQRRAPPQLNSTGSRRAASQVKANPPLPIECIDDGPHTFSWVRPASQECASGENSSHNGAALRVGGSEEVEFVDEEAMFNMPLLLDCMAQGMLLTPPSIKKGFSWDQINEDVVMEEDFTLWEH